MPSTQRMVCGSSSDGIQAPSAPAKSVVDQGCDQDAEDDR